MELLINEKRKQERYVLDAPIHIKYWKDSKPAVLLGRSRDISSTGVFINTPGTQLHPAQSVHLELTLTINKLKELFGCSKKVTLEIEGSVLRSHHDGFVIKFDSYYSIFPEVDANLQDCIGFDAPGMARRVGI